MEGYNFLKRVLDITTAIAVGLFFLPLMVLIAVAIKLDSHGPIFYFQKRVGKNGKLFDMLKFRSMVDEADQYLLQNPSYLRKFKNPSGWKGGMASEDPRITRVGRFIRKYSFDELPQVWNILKGDMSMVGPRPYRNDVLGNEIREQLRVYPQLRAKVDKALSVKPGLTGPWQVSGRNELSWGKRVELDAKYAQQRSLSNDLVIILKSPLAMLSKW